MRNIATTNNIRELVNAIVSYNPDYLVIEGYNAVGKGLVTEQLSEVLNFNVYRPNYTGWVQSVPRECRWAIFSSFMDIVTETRQKSESVLLFDRGIFSGVVYNNDKSLCQYYKSIVKDYRVLHILVECSEEDYNKFLKVRSSDKPLSYEDCLEYTKRYEEAFEIAGADYIVYNNKFNDGMNYEKVCAGCSHYSFHDNKCSNPLAVQSGIDNVSPNRERCEYSSLKEVQDGKL